MDECLAIPYAHLCASGSDELQTIFFFNFMHRVILLLSIKKKKKKKKKKKLQSTGILDRY